MSITATKQGQLQKSVLAANTSLLFNNSVTHDISSQYPSRNTNNIVSNNGERAFEYPPNPSVSPTNHLELLRDSQMVGKLSTYKKQQLSSVHSSTTDPNVNIFKLNEGEYEHLTYQPPIVINKRFKPPKEEGKSNNNYKFQMSEQEFKEQISKVPHAGLNPFHLIPDINPAMSDLVTQQLPIYNQLSQKNKKNMLDCSALNNNNNNTYISKDQEIDQSISNTIASQNIVPQTFELTLPPIQEVYPQLQSSVSQKQLKVLQPNLFLGSSLNNTSTVSLDHSEFQLFYKQKAQQDKILKDQQLAINESARLHPPNFQGKSELAQLAKCMILNANNSPFAFKSANNVSLGKSSDLLARISRFTDPLYFELLCEQDKTDKLKSAPKLLENMLDSKSSQGRIQFGRLAQGLMKQHDPSQNLKYAKKTEQPPRKNQNSKKTLTLKRQNLYRNLASFNYLAHSVRISEEDHMEEIDKHYVKKTTKLPEQSVRKSLPSFKHAFVQPDSTK